MLRRHAAAADPSVEAPAPADVSVRRGAGAFGSDRVTITWDGRAVRDVWLEVPPMGGGGVGLSSADVFKFGNLVGETGYGAQLASVTARDLLFTRRALYSAATLHSRYDSDCDGRVGVTACHRCWPSRHAPSSRRPRSLTRMPPHASSVPAARRTRFSSSAASPPTPGGGGQRAVRQRARDDATPGAKFVCDISTRQG